MSVIEVARVVLPTPFGPFDTRAFQCPSGFVYLAMVRGDLGGGGAVLARVHSECLTGDAIGSLRCDCGIQLRSSLRTIAAAGRGVLVYATGHEGRGIGLVNKLRAYMQQDLGRDTVDANLHLGLPADGRTYHDAGRVLQAIGAGRVRLMSNNPWKIRGLETSGVTVEEVVPVAVAPHVRSLTYLDTKRTRLGHLAPLASPDPLGASRPTDVGTIVGKVNAPERRPYVVVKYAQTLDGRIATRSGDSRWISGDQERALAHTLRSHCDAILVGIGTVLADDPRLTVRLVPGASPIRVVLDSRLRIPKDARVLGDDAATIIVTTERSSAGKRERLRRHGADVRVVASSDGRVDIASAMAALSDAGIESLLVEGGAKIITSVLSAALVDRLVVSVSPKLIGRGIEAIGDLGILQVGSGIELHDVSLHSVGHDVVIAATPEMPARGNGHSPTVVPASNVATPE